MTAICPLHDVAMIEKQGEFGSYFSHIIKEVGFCNGKKIKPFTKQPDSNVTRESVKERDYDAEARGKVRHGVSIAVIEKVGGRPTPEIKAQINEWVEFIMTGD